MRCPGGERARRLSKRSEHMTGLKIRTLFWRPPYVQSKNEIDQNGFAFTVSADPGIPAGFQPLCPFSERVCRRGEGFVTLIIGKFLYVYKCHVEWALFQHVDEYWMQIFLHTLCPYGP